MTADNYAELLFLLHNPNQVKQSLGLVMMNAAAAIEALQKKLSDHLESESAETMRADRHKAERDALHKDAERYRWLRVNSTRPAEPWSTHSPESFDSIVDVSRAALAAGKGEGEK